MLSFFHFQFRKAAFFKIQKKNSILHLVNERYTDYKDPDMEANIEEVLTAHELYYEKSEVWIETEKMYEVLYELTV